jgi:CRP-like cAMP-binding protein
MRLHKDAKVEAMKTVPLFENCSRKDLEQVARLADELDFPAGKTLIREGERGYECFVVLDGEVEVSRRGQKVPRQGGDVFGELALVCDVPRTATVTTTSPVRALVLGAREFRTLMQEHPAIQTRILERLAERVATLEPSGG